MKKKERNKSNEVSIVPVNHGNLLEGKLLEWRGGYQHIRGIAEYISNSDDSFRRLKKFTNQKIVVSIHSKTGRKLSKLTIEDWAEGMSMEDLDKKFFIYYESHSGRDQGELVTGRYGTGGKAYAIMNFKHCWITSTKNKLQCKFWFKWDEENKVIIKGYNNNGYINKHVKDNDGTNIELVEGKDNKIELLEFFIKLQKKARIRHVLKSQEVIFNVHSKKGNLDEKIEYKGPNPNDAFKNWVFELPPKLRNINQEENFFVLRYFEKKLNEENFIDISDGISSVSDYDITKLDGRPFSKYLNGELIIRQLQDSNAVKENRKGLEEGNDLTIEIEDFSRECVRKVINEVEVLHKEKEKNRNIEVSNEKIKELNKFLRKCEMNFKDELKELVRKFKTDGKSNGGSNNHEDEQIKIYRKPTADDGVENLIKGFWKLQPGIRIDPNPNPDPIPQPNVPVFIPDLNGDEFAVEVGKRGIAEKTERTKKSGLQVLMSDDNSIPEVEPPYYSEYDDPMSDRDMITKGIIWINANNPIIRKGREKKENEAIFKENVANYVLLVVSQYQAQKLLDSQSPDERNDPMLEFRKRFFELQRNLREDKELNYYEDEN